MQEQSKLAQLEATIIEQCDNLTWVVTGIFVLSIFLTILRPDPTLAICLFAFLRSPPRVVPPDVLVVLACVLAAHGKVI